MERGGSSGLLAALVPHFSFLVPWFGSSWASRRSHLGAACHFALASPGGGVSRRHLFDDRPHCRGDDVSEKLKVNFDKTNSVNSKVTVGLTEAGSTTVFSSLQNVCRASHTSFLFSSHARTLQWLLPS